MDYMKRLRLTVQVRSRFSVGLPFADASFYWHGITSTSVTAVNVFDEIIALSGYSDMGKNILVESYLTTFTFLDFGKGERGDLSCNICRYP